MTWADRGALRTVDYADGRRLAARQSIYRWQRPQVDLSELIGAALAPVPGGALVGDLGCGNGALLARVRAACPDLRCLALDLSEGMLREVDGAARVCGSLDALPVADAALDAALAMHTLYHLPDPARGIAELRRAVRPGGTLVASTNSATNLAELWDLLEACGGRRSAVLGHWPLERAADALGAAFDDVQVSTIDYVLDVPDVEPVTAYLASTGAPSAVLSRAGERVAEVIARDGAFRTSGRVGVLVAR